MSAVAEKTEVTPDELLAMPDETDYELVDSQLVERNVSVLSSWVGGRIYRYLADFAETWNLGMVWPNDNGYQCFPDAPRKVRRADASFIKHARLPRDWQSLGYSRTPPDLAVEVVSPNDPAIDVEAKLVEYLKAGVSLIWVVYPEIRTVRVHRADFSAAYLTETDNLSGEDVLPGFVCRVGAIFPPTDPAASVEPAGADTVQS